MFFYFLYVCMYRMSRLYRTFKVILWLFLVDKILFQSSKYLPWLGFQDRSMCVYLTEWKWDFALLKWIFPLQYASPTESLTPLGLLYDRWLIKDLDLLKAVVQITVITEGRRGIQYLQLLSYFIYPILLNRVKKQTSTQWSNFKSNITINKKQ